MNIHIASTDRDISDCFSVMRELRPHIPEQEFLERIRRQEQSGYRLAYISGSNKVLSVAGFRLTENLAWGRFLYVDDLVTSTDHRSAGHGSRLLAWLKDYALSKDCMQIHLDSGIHRQAAHKFYEREGLTKAGYHFYQEL